MTGRHGGEAAPRPVIAAAIRSEVSTPLATILLLAARLVRDALAVQLGDGLGPHDPTAAVEVMAKLDALMPALERLVSEPVRKSTCLLDTPQRPVQVRVPTWWSAPQAIAVFDFLTDIEAAVWEAHDTALTNLCRWDAMIDNNHEPEDSSDEEDLPF